MDGSSRPALGNNDRMDFPPSTFDQVASEGHEQHAQMQDPTMRDNSNASDAAVVTTNDRPFWKTYVELVDEAGTTLRITNEQLWQQYPEHQLEIARSLERWLQQQRDTPPLSSITRPTEPTIGNGVATNINSGFVQPRLSTTHDQLTFPAMRPQQGGIQPTQTAINGVDEDNDDDIDIGQNDEYWLHDSPEAAARYLAQPDEDECVGIDVEGNDDWLVVKNRLRYPLARQLLQALSHPPTPVPNSTPANLESDRKDYQIVRNIAEWRPKTKANDNSPAIPAGKKVIQALVMKVIDIAIAVHEDGIPKFDLRPGSGLLKPSKLNCLARVNLIIMVIRNDAMCKRDLAEGKSLKNMVYNPEKYVRQKYNNRKGNGKRTPAQGNTTGGAGAVPPQPPPPGRPPDDQVGPKKRGRPPGSGKGRKKQTKPKSVASQAAFDGGFDQESSLGKRKRVDSVADASGTQDDGGDSNGRRTRSAARLATASPATNDLLQAYNAAHQFAVPAPYNGAYQWPDSANQPGPVSAGSEFDRSAIGSTPYPEPQYGYQYTPQPYYDGQTQYPSSQQQPSPYYGFSQQTQHPPVTTGQAQGLTRSDAQDEQNSAVPAATEPADDDLFDDFTNRES